MCAAKHTQATIGSTLRLLQDNALLLELAGGPTDVDALIGLQYVATHLDLPARKSDDSGREEPDGPSS